MNTIVADAVGKSITPLDMEGYAKDLISDGNVMEISSSIDWIFSGDSVVIVTPDGAPSAKTVVDKIEADIAIWAKDTLYGKLDIGESTNIDIDSDTIKGRAGTVVTLRDSDTGEILYIRAYVGQELKYGMSNEDEQTLKDIRADRIKTKEKKEADIQKESSKKLFSKRPKRK